MSWRRTRGPTRFAVSTAAESDRDRRSTFQK
jgi:hypothetical protein